MLLIEIVMHPRVWALIVVVVIMGKDSRRAREQSSERHGKQGRLQYVGSHTNILSLPSTEEGLTGIVMIISMLSIEFVVCSLVLCLECTMLCLVCTPQLTMQT